MTLEQALGPEVPSFDDYAISSGAAIVEGELNHKQPENETDEFIDFIATNKSGHGKASVYFVIFATVLALGIFAYSLVRLIKQCRREKAYQRDLFCRASTDDKNNNSGTDERREGSQIVHI